MANSRNLSTAELIDIYSALGIADLSDNITKMIKHDCITNKKNLNCIIDYSKNIETANEILKKDFKESRTF